MQNILALCLTSYVCCKFEGGETRSTTSYKKVLENCRLFAFVSSSTAMQLIKRRKNAPNFVYWARTE